MHNFIETEEFENQMLKYKSALKILETQLEILKDEFESKNNYNPIEHITSRLKTKESILGKMQLRNYDLTIDNMIEKLNDVAGVRIVCSFINDVYTLVDIIKKTENIEVIEEKDYIKTPKESGYSSFHLIVKIPVSLIDEETKVKAEIQIRTLAMDFWANVDHKLQYKCFANTSSDFSEELVKCSKEIRNLDYNMCKLIEKINES